MFIFVGSEEIRQPIVMPMEPPKATACVHAAPLDAAVQNICGRIESVLDEDAKRTITAPESTQPFAFEA